MKRALPGALAGGILIGTMVLSTAPVAGVLFWLLRAGAWPAYAWLLTAPLVYLAWLITFLSVSAALCSGLGARHPKPRYAVFDADKGIRGVDPGLVTVMVCYRIFAVLQTAPFMSVIAQLPYLNVLMFRAYAPRVSLPPSAVVMGRLHDPDLTEIGHRAVIGGGAAVVAHSMAFRPTGERVYVSAPVTIGDRATVGGESLVNLGCTIGPDAILEPGSVLEAFARIPAGEVWGGNPARFRRTRDDLDADGGPRVTSAPHTGAADTLGSGDLAVALGPAATAVRPVEPTSRGATPSPSAVDVRELVLQALGLTAAEAPENLSSDTCARWDSLGQVAIAAALFDRYGLTIEPRSMFRLKNLRDVAEIVTAQGGVGAAETPVHSRGTDTASHRLDEPERGRDGSQPPLDDVHMLPLLDSQAATRALAATAGSARPGGAPVRINIAATFTANALEPTLLLWGRAFGLDITCGFAGYGRVAESLLDTDGILGGAGIAVVLARPEDFAGESGEAQLERLDQVLDALEHAARREPANRRLLVGTLPPVVSSFSVLDREGVAALRRAWHDRLKTCPNVELFDFAGVVERAGIDAARSNEGEVLTRAPYSPRLFQALAMALVRQVRVGRSTPAKVIALDCDNTLWGGVVGEVGLDGIQLGPDGPGRAFQLFQRRLKHLKDRGLLLVVASRNEPADVQSVFEQHPGMVLSVDDIAAWRVNWRPKSENLRELAEELNLGLDAFVFVDDDAATRLEVKTRVPSVHVVPMPGEPFAFSETLERLWLFDGAAPTDVDAARTRMAQEEQRRKEERGVAVTLEDFLARLELEVDFRQAGDRDLPRVAQLTQRTNQFNLSLKRRSLEEVRSISAPSAVLVVDARDRFGDYGQVGVAIIGPSREPAAWEIDTLLMSCRALGRGVEDAFLHGLAAIASEAGATRLLATFTPGPRNAQVRDFLRRTGFEELAEDVWQRSLGELPPLPVHVRFRRDARAPAGRAVARAAEPPPTLEPVLAARRASAPLVVLAYETLIDQMPGLRESIQILAAGQDDEFWSDGQARCREILYLCGGDVAKFRDAVSAWVNFSMEYLARQNEFLKTGQYASTSFQELQHELYDNDERMQGFYLLALMFSFLFSANYIGYYKFFRDEMVPRVQRARSLCDVGCGHGVYLSQMLLRSGEAFGHGLDISDASLATAGSLLRFHDVSPGRYRLAKADLRGTLPLGSGTQDGATCFEVLEHLDDPRHALSEIHRVLAEGAPLCVSAAVRMESVDHLFVFEHPQAVRTLLIETGFTIIRDDFFPLKPDGTGTADRQALADDPRVSLGYVALAVARSGLGETRPGRPERSVEELPPPPRHVVFR